MMKMTQRDREKIYRKVRKDSEVYNKVMTIVHSNIFLNEPYEKAMSKLSRKTNVDSLIKIAKDRRASPEDKESISIRKLAISILAKMNDRLKDNKINAALLELAEDRERDISSFAVDSLPIDIKEDRIESLIRGIEKEDDSNKRWDLFVKLYPFLDESIANRLFDICYDKEDMAIEVELLHFVNRLSLH